MGVDIKKEPWCFEGYDEAQLKQNNRSGYDYRNNNRNQSIYTNR